LRCTARLFQTPLSRALADSKEAVVIGWGGPAATGSAALATRNSDTLAVGWSRQGEQVGANESKTVHVTIAVAAEYV
jgi:hypothetical protein